MGVIKDVCDTEDVEESVPEKDAKNGEGDGELEMGGDSVPKLDPLLLPLELTVALPTSPTPPPGVNEGEEDTAGVKEAREVSVVPLLIEGVASAVREREGEGVAKLALRNRKHKYM